MSDNIADRYRLCQVHQDGILWNWCEEDFKDCEIEKALQDEEYVKFRTPPEICTECGVENPECGWSSARNHDPHDRVCFDCDEPPYGSGKNLKKGA